MQRILATLALDKPLISVYFTAGYPNLNDTETIIKNLEKSGVDMIEIGLPFSDPLADGPTIQQSSTWALANGMTTEILFTQLKNIRPTVQIPLLIMAYFNPIMQYGVEQFLKKCVETGIDGLIIPDLPIEIFEQEYQELFKAYQLSFIPLITPETPESRIQKIDTLATSFIYMVSSSSVTGSKDTFEDAQLEYFKKIADLQLKHPQIIGFGISNKTTFGQATQYQKGAIIGSSFIRFVTEKGVAETENFILTLQ